jgi:hypothetical protein
MGGFNRKVDGTQIYQFSTRDRPAVSGSLRLGYEMRIYVNDFCISVLVYEKEVHAECAYTAETFNEIR